MFIAGSAAPCTRYTCHRVQLQIAHPDLYTQGASRPFIGALACAKKRARSGDHYQTRVKLLILIRGEISYITGIIILELMSTCTHDKPNTQSLLSIYTSMTYIDSDQSENKRET